MAPQRFASVRSKTKPPARIAPFRDDTGLVAFRYEQTKQAEPPIPLPPRNPLRASRRHSTQSTAASASPVIITPPAIPPPHDQHPLFRLQQSSLPRVPEHKRDSFIAATSSSVTLRDEYQVDVVFGKLVDEAPDTPSMYSGDDKSFIEKTSPSRPAPLRLSPRPGRPATPTAATAESPTQATQPTTPSRAASFSQKLGKTFSLRSAGAKRLRKKTLGEDKAVTPDAPLGNMRGSLTSPDFPKSPGTGSPPRSVARSTNGMQRDCLPSQSGEMDFAPITTTIPEDSLWDDLGNLSFSKRGSIMFGGRNDTLAPSLMARLGDGATADEKPTGTTSDTNAQPAGVIVVDATSAMKRTTTHESSPSVPSIHLLSIDAERESQKVRSLYESGDVLNWQDGRVSFCERLEPTEEVPSDEEENVVSSLPLNPPSNPPSSDRRTTRTPTIATPRSVSSLSPRDSLVRREYERAGGLEDWEDVEGADVDRYGFISQRRPGSRSGTPELKSAQLSPRRRNVLTKRPGSAYSSSPLGLSLRPPSRKVSTRSLNTFASEFSTTSRRSTRSSIRSAANHLPHNRDRRWMDEAGDMLASQPGEQDVENKMSEKAVEALKRKELERSEKWRKMAKVIKKGEEGQGMDFEFDTKNPKLIERTWKGIPDCWRAAAWHSFLATSATAWKSTETDEMLMGEFRRLQEMGSPDDVQIDLDVPRTVNGHIMFRKRYRGGQRLLFRVLHAISLYFPGTGYVQGMACLAATLLCYYDEERCFVMLVRMWKYRGLERLYQPGFGALMSTLQELEARWLPGKDVADKLTELSIDPTAYGTRWYLTLFNLSIPFAAQLRVWDVFLLLGDCPPEGSSADSSRGKAKESNSNGPRGLDVLHATSAAIIHALREVLLDSDFENAMKALTSWIPIKDEDLLMKVAHASWRQHQVKRKDNA
ncbi:hypothetical protein B0T19DRAFT_403502 [Cercophora scortea]|uniref:Rab-GAP TBC domain-containing protein n=1 Tax=Cercophora scortea TaxID=314031 RepID=A0AAE0I9P1_9PEZI|nr:hypothetical protein B0T19DRAFT_403502 [Cercophora scortea]